MKIELSALGLNAASAFASSIDRILAEQRRGTAERAAMAETVLGVCPMCAGVNAGGCSWCHGQPYYMQQVVHPKAAEPSHPAYAVTLCPDGRERIVEVAR